MKKLLLLFALLYSLQGFSQPGNLNPSFGTGGHVALGATFQSTAFESDGKLVGTQEISGGFSLTRYNNDGTLDAGFGSGGTVTIHIPDMVGGTYSLVASQNHGKIVVEVLGHPSVPKKGIIALARFNSNGTLDATFGTGGIAVILSYDTGEGMLEIFRFIVELAIQSDGKIVTLSGWKQFRYHAYVISRYNANGTPDASFGAVTVVSGADTGPGTGNTPILNSLLIQSDRKILVSGGRHRPVMNIDLLIIRLNSSGSDGVTTGYGPADFHVSGSNELGTALGVQEDGKIVAATVSGKLLRFNPNGTLDASFGTSGIVSFAFRINKILVQSDGKILVGGSQSGAFALARYNPNGSLDASFGTGGITTSNFGTPNEGIGDMMIVDGCHLYAFGSGIEALYRLCAPTVGTLSCPAPKVVPTNVGCCTAVVTGIDPICSISTNVPLVHYTLSGATTGSGSGSVSGKTFNKGVTTVTYTSASDATQQCSFIVTVEDRTVPTITTCPSVAPLYKCANNTYSIPKLTATDNCGGVSTTYTISGATSRSGSGEDASGIFNIGTSTITWTVKDESGNTATCQTTVSVVVDKLSLQATPNPSSSYFTVSIGSNNREGNITLNVYNAFCNKVETKKVTANETVQIGASYPRGIYLVEVVQGSKKVVAVVIKL